MKPEDLLKLFEGDAKVLEEEVSAIERMLADQGLEPSPPLRLGVPSKKTKRKPTLIAWERIEGPLTPRSFPLPDNLLTSSFRDKLGDMFAHATEPCPDIETMTLYVNHELDSVTAEHVSAHLRHCEDCAEEFIGLSRVSDRP